MRKIILTSLLLIFTFNFANADQIPDADITVTENENINWSKKNHYFTGTKKVIWNNGEITINEMVNSKPEGIGRLYYKSGALKSEWTIKNGRLEGAAKDYYENGSLKEERYYIIDRTNGICKKYDDKGVLEVECKRSLKKGLFVEAATK